MEAEARVRFVRASLGQAARSMSSPGAVPYCVSWSMGRHSWPPLRLLLTELAEHDEQAACLLAAWTAASTEPTEAPEFRGPGRDDPEPTGPGEVAIGIVFPASGTDAAAGMRMRNGATLAIEDANEGGGLRPGVPFASLFLDEGLAWGGAANLVVDAVMDRQVWGLVGALEDASSHVMARVLLKVEAPMVNTNGSDPTLTEHAIPWIVRVRPDDRQACYRLASRIFETDGHQRVVVFRANDRYGRVGTREFVDAARRLHHPIALEMRFENHDTSWSFQLARIAQARPDAILLWGRPDPAGRVLRQLREAGLDVPVYGPDRLLDPAFLEAAGAAAEGVVVTYPFDLDSQEETWLAFSARYRERFGTGPDAVSAYAYDGATLLTQCMRRAGLNRARIRDELFAVSNFEGVMGSIEFDITHNNVGEGVLATVRQGVFVFE